MRVDEDNLTAFSTARGVAPRQGPEARLGFEVGPRGNAQRIGDPARQP